MSEPTIIEKLTEILARELGVPQNQITPQSRLREDLGADHLHMQTILLALDETWNLEIESSRAESLLTVADLESLISELCLQE